MQMLRLIIKPIFSCFLIVGLIPAGYAEQSINLTCIHNELVEQNFSGNLLIADGETILLQRQYGIANRETNAAYTERTVFGIGSVTKQFVATAILKLAEQDKLSLSDTLPAFFDDVPEDKRSITLHQLLSQSSGFPTNFKGKQLYEVLPHDVLAREAFKVKLSFEPGTQYQYSNIGYSLLARVIEKVSGENWEQFIREEILLPADLRQTGYRIPQYDESHLAVNYGADPNAFQRMFGIQAKSKPVGHSLAHLNENEGERWFEGAGGFVSTQEDMFKWYLALRRKSILSEKSWESMFTPHVAENDSGTWHYGYGWAITSENGQKRITHNGSNGYSFAEFSYYPSLDVFIFVSTNDIDNYPEALIQRLYELVVQHDQSQ
ncbi:serine hydrolase domain-containing protein [Alteromonas facilis]|uniref:serine hydrolase domain-containing protein n=1 Tax=Alteromonas facilis TaxID=2048004 RepID=UPI000C28E281|nr:serine hydrolase domain-containing protein [Alteromonas facilis]